MKNNDYSKYVIDFDKVLNNGDDFEAIKEDILKAYNQAKREKESREEKKKKLAEAKDNIEIAIGEYLEAVGIGNREYTITFHSSRDGKSDVVDFAIGKIYGTDKDKNVQKAPQEFYNILRDMLSFL